MRIQFTHYYHKSVYCQCVYEDGTLTTNRGTYILENNQWIHSDGPNNVSETQLEAILTHIETIIASQPEL